MRKGTCARSTPPAISAWRFTRRTMSGSVCATAIRNATGRSATSNTRWCGRWRAGRWETDAYRITGAGTRRGLPRPGDAGRAAGGAEGGRAGGNRTLTLFLGLGRDEVYRDSVMLGAQREAANGGKLLFHVDH